MENDKKLAISVMPGADGKVELSNGITVLEDCTLGRFKTNSIDDFVAYLTGQDAPKAFVFYGPGACQAFDTLEPKIGCRPVASCDLETSPILKLLSDINNSKLSIDMFEDLIRTTRSNLTGDSATKLLDFIDNVNITKVKSVVRQKDGVGNYHYAITSGPGPQDFVFPKSLTFKLPLVHNCKEEREVSFDFYFSFEEKDESVQLYFKLKNLRLHETVQDAIAEIVLGKLTNGGLWARRGFFEVTDRTNSWKYQRNPLEVNGL